MSNTYEMKQLTGTLFTETNVTVPRKGKVKFFDNKEWYCNILKYTGEKEKYEFCVSLGLLHYNAPEAHIALLLWLREPRALPITVPVPHALHFFELLVIYRVPVLEGSRVRTGLSTAASAYRVAVLVKSFVGIRLCPDVRLV